MELTSRYRRRRLLVAIVTVALGGPAAAQRGVDASIEVRPERVTVGEHFQAIITLQGVDPRRTRVIAPSLVDGVVLVGEPTVRESLRGVAITYLLQAVSLGTHTLDSFIIRTPGASVTTTPMQVSVAERLSNRTPKPLLHWILADTSPLAWQAVTATLELTVNAPLRLPTIPVLPAADRLLIERSPTQGSIRQLDGTDRYVVPIASYRVIGTAGGPAVLPSAGVRVDRADVFSAPVPLLIRELPSAAAATRAVGALTRTVHATWISGDELAVTITVAGADSPGSLRHPVPGTPIGTVSMIDDAQGSTPPPEGERTWSFLVSDSDSDSDVVVLIPAFHYIRLPHESEQIIPAQELRVAARQPVETIRSGSEPVLSATEPTARCGRPSGRLLRLLLLVPGVILALVGGPLVARPHTALVLVLVSALGAAAAARADEHVHSGVAAYAAGDFESAVLVFRAALHEPRACAPRLLYYIGAAELRRGNTGEAVHALRASLTSSASDEASDLLAHLEARTGLKHLARIPRSLRILEHTTLAAAILVTMLGVLTRCRRTRRLVIISFAAIIVSALGIMLVPERLPLVRAVSIVRTDQARVQTIPATDGTVLSRLPAGTPVTVLRRFEDYSLIAVEKRTGWIASDAFAGRVVSARGR